MHGLAGLAHASINTWPMLLVAGSAEQVLDHHNTPAPQSYDHSSIDAWSSPCAVRPAPFADVSHFMLTSYKASRFGVPCPSGMTPFRESSACCTRHAKQMVLLPSFCCSANLAGAFAARDDNHLLFL